MAGDKAKGKRREWVRPQAMEGFLTPMTCRHCDRLVVRTEVDGLVTDLEPRLVDGELEETAWQVGMTTYEPVLMGWKKLYFNWRNPLNQRNRVLSKVAVLHVCPSAAGS